MRKVLILTNKEDVHAKRVTEELIKRKALPINWFPDEFLVNQRIVQKITPNAAHYIVINEKKVIDLMDINVVWYRRVSTPVLPKNLSRLDHKFIQKENRIFMKSLWLTLSESSRWVNPFSSLDQSNSKISQLRLANSLGLTIPETLVTNDKNEIINFINENLQDGTIYKTFSPAMWEENNEIFSCYTTVITTDMLSSEANMALTPGIYQKYVKKSFEVRVTFIGNEYIAIKIHNSENLDWRILASTSNFKISPIVIPPEIEQKCIALMNKLNIVFGCFDFIVTPMGEYIFLEVNEMGQFLWIEEILPELKLLDKFCEFLISSGANTSIKNSNVQSLSLKEIEAST